MDGRGRRHPRLAAIGSMAVDDREQLLILSDFNADVLAGLATNDARTPAVAAKSAEEAVWAPVG